MGRVRQADIARVAGVSQATVSVVLGGNRTGVRLAESTRLRVLEAAQRLGYADPLAKRQAGHDLFGICAAGPVFEAHQAVLAGIAAEAAALGKDLIMFAASGPALVRRTRLADGCLFVGGSVPVELLTGGFPIVHIGRRAELGGRVPCVDADYASASAEVITRLVRAGHRRIRYLREPADTPAARERERGIRTTAGTAGLVLGTDATALDAAAVRGWLDDGVTALVVDEAVVAPAQRALRAAGATVPGEVSLAVLGRPPSGTAGPEISGFELPRRALGREAVRLLASVVVGTGAGEHRLLTCPPVAGETIAPVA
ncbi:LacI family transcriptional regulator [Amycolatopsis mediterranei S699]|uniref:LacI family transcriptional regulator n=3 Tax=Amycolatopsis mediterranei TaxID=33910 RepID=A0A0H3D8J4_AMYMU|nr:LacI family DNA-binding transcriptional regulator [Amycolatopsis mediterranei]ADJ46393.1 LacI family transcriptional regulator [Amycolatopsis mediterranei U32]AEK43189.1 LacI family transcriptional regulator [Amycolatopsis mediterranei S699]AFO78104.1 LacI family transcriptional regulator [Amycolatopsis mediterranei S699]AGT85232.1 LacI family transcriptional regulator [Amycolatopsis mediterranei RB]KDO06368.1 LacI family transcriptional regulator [Amycolatopsis mediterranei]